MSEQRERFDLNIVQVVASALAAVSSAVLLSTVGVAGTLIGAAVGSVVATVGSALYSYSLRASRERVAAAQAVALAKVGRSRRTGQQVVVDADDPEVRSATRPSLREALTKLPWKRISLVTVGVFAAAMIAIVSFELIAGRSVSTITGGSSGNGARTSVPGLGKVASSPKATPSQTPSTSTSSPSASTSSPPSASPSQSPSASPSTSTSPSPSPSVTPSEQPTPTPTPTRSATPTPSASATPTTGLTPTPSPGR